MSDVIPIERLTSRQDLFRCVPYSCILAAGACIDRQSARPMLRGREILSRWSYPKCATCPDGAKVVEAIARGMPVTHDDAEEEAIAEEEIAVSMCEYKGCESAAGRMITGDHRRTSEELKPFCIKHRKLIRDSKRALDMHPIKANGFREYQKSTRTKGDHPHIGLVRSALEKCGGSVGTLALRIGVTYNSPMHWLRGKCSPGHELVKKMEAIVNDEEVLPRPIKQVVAHSAVAPVDTASKEFALRLAYKALRDLGNDTAALAIADILLA